MSLISPRPPRRARRDRRRPTVLSVLGVVAVLVVAIIVRVVTMSPPKVVAHRVLPASVRLGGAAPSPSWPVAGEAAFAVEGLGSLGSSGGDAPRPIASVAKVMTAYLVLRDHPLHGSDAGFETTVTPAQASEEASEARRGDSVVPVAAGETLSERQLLEALLVYSGDNIARLLAVQEAGSVPRFVTEMNTEARTLHMDHTTYTDPSGLAATTVSDAADQLHLLERAIRDPTFRQIVALPSVTLPVAGMVRNYDPLIADGYAGKTGSDSAAEGCLAFFKRLTVGGRTLTSVGVVLGQGVGSDTSVILGAAGDAAADLVASVQRAITVHTVVARGARVLSARAADGNAVPAVSDRALRVVGWGGASEPLSVGSRRLGTGLRAGQAVGSVTAAGRLPLATGSSRSATVRASTRLPGPGLGWRLAHLL